MDRLSLFIAMMMWSVISGAIIILFMSLGYVGWIAFALAVVLGFAVGIPAAKMISARIKRQDPDWDEKRNRPDPTTPNLTANTMSDTEFGTDRRVGKPLR